MVSEEKIKEFHKYFCDLLEFDIEKESKKKSRTINLFSNQYDYEKALVKSYNSINSGKFDYALFYIHSIVDSVFEDFKNNITSDDSALVDQFPKHIQITKEVKACYNDWLENDFKNYILSFEKTGLFSSEELTKTKEFDVDSLVQIDQTIDEGKLLKFYSYQHGTQPLDEFGKNISIGKKMVVSRSLTEFLAHFGSQAQDDQTRISLIMKVERRTEFTFFVLAIQHKDHLWIFTDVTDFDNPRNRESRRNDRCRHDYWDNLNLPYDLIEKIKKIFSKKSTELQLLNSSEVEYALYPIDKLSTDQKIFYLTLANKCVDKVKFTPNPNRVITMGDFINQKMIAGKVEMNGDDMINNSGFSEHFWDEACRERASEILETLSLKQGNEGALIKISSDIIVKDRNFDKDWLATPEHMQNLTKWIALNKEVNAMQKVLEFKEKEIKEAWNQLDKLINTPENITRLHKFLFASKKVYFRFDNFYSYHIHSDNEGSCFWNEKIKKHYFDFCEPGQERFRTPLYIGSTKSEIKKRLENGYDKKCLCKFCDKDKHIVTVKKITIYHYRQLLFLIGSTDRNLLPLYFRNYKSCVFIPYEGNSILDHLHPFSDLRDHCSEQYVNGIDIDVIMCRVCANRLHRENNFADTTAIYEDFTLHKYKEEK